MNPYLIIAAGIALLLSGVFGFRLGAEHQIASQAKTVQLIAAVEQRAQLGAATAIAANKPVHQYNKQVVEREVRTVVDYSKCEHSDDGLRAVNAALANTRTESASDSVVPGANTVDR